MRKLITSLLFMLSLGCSTIALAEHVNGIAAIVNDDLITQAQLNKTIKKVKLNIQKQHAAVPSDSVLRHKVLDRMINDQLQFQLAKQYKIEIKPAEVTRAINNVATQNHMTPKEFKAKLAEKHIPYNEYREDIKKQMMLSRVQQQALMGKVHANEHEVKKVLHQYGGANSAIYHINSILIPLDENADPEEVYTARKLAKKVSAAWRKTDKASSAMANFPEQDLDEVDLGMRRLKDLPSIFTRVARGMKVGDVSAPIHASNGFHVIKLVEKKKNPNAITREKAESMLTQKAYMKEMERFLADVRKKSYIKVLI